MDEKLKEKIKGLIEKEGKKLNSERKTLMEKVLMEMWDQENPKIPKEALGLTEAQMELLYGYGYKIFQSGKYGEALDYFNALRFLDPASYRYTFGVASCYQFLQQWEMASAFYLLCSYIERDNPLPHYHLYECFREQNDPHSCLRALKDTIEAAADNPEYTGLKQRAVLEYKRLKKEMKKLQEKASVS